MNKILLCLLGMALLFPRVGRCGTGSYVDGSPDTIQLLVHFEYNEPNPASWAPLFREASRLLFDATEKQVKIGKVTLFRMCPDLVNRADVRIFWGPGGANANVGGFGRPGTRIQLFQTHKTVTTAGPGDRGQLGLVHEMGHYTFGLLDEYLNKQGIKDQNAFCVNSGGITASIMDGGTRVPTKNLRTEFCTAPEHRRGRTAQDSRRAIGTRFFEDTDGWTWLVAWARERYGVTLRPPAGTPLPDRTGFGADPVIESASCDLRVSVSIDSSGSMSGSPVFERQDEVQGEDVGDAVESLGGEAPIDVAKQAAGKFLRLLQEGEAAGVVSVGGNTEAIPLREMNIDERFRSLKALQNIEAEGRTNWEELLEEPLEQLAGEDGGEVPAVPGNEAVLLISDGTQASAGPSEETLAPLTERGVVVHTIGLGKDESTGLRRIATETGGNFLFARSEKEVDSHVLTVLAQVRSQGVIEDRTENIEPGGSRRVQILVDAATAAEAVDFLLSWSDGEGGFQMELTDPSGDQVDAAAPSAIFQEDFEQKLKRYRVQQPEKGIWTVRIANTGSVPRDVTFQVHALTSAVTASAYAEKDVLASSEPLVLRATVTVGDLVGGAIVRARIVGPEGAPVEIPLFDDGAFEHADDRANDGTYSNVYTGATGSGSYTVDVTFDAAHGFTVSAGEDGGDFTPRPVEPFLRKTKFSIVVQAQ